MEDFKQNIAIIESMIHTAKRNLKDSSPYYLLWGWLVLIAAVSNYILMQINYSNDWIAWPILMSLGGIISIFISIRQSKKSRVTTYTDRAMMFLWIGFIVTLFLLFVGAPSIGIEAVYPVTMLLYGFGTFVSGGLLKFTPLKIGGVCAWVCGAIAFHFDFEDQLILIMAAIITSYIIPGHLLANAKETNV